MGVFAQIDLVEEIEHQQFLAGIDQEDDGTGGGHAAGEIVGKTGKEGGLHARQDHVPQDRHPAAAQITSRHKEGAERYDISAVIYVMRDTQKGIIIGKGGQSLKKVGTQARIEMEDFFQKKVFLSLYVKVDADWRESKKELRRFGYEY